MQEFENELEGLLSSPRHQFLLRATHLVRRWGATPPDRGAAITITKRQLQEAKAERSARAKEATALLNVFQGVHKAVGVAQDHAQQLTGML